MARRRRKARKGFGSTSLIMPDDFADLVSSLGKEADRIIPIALAAGAEICKEDLQRSLGVALSKKPENVKRQTGKLMSSIGITKARVDDDGNWNIKIGFGENRGEDEASNAVIARSIDIGKYGQAPTRFIAEARYRSRHVAVNTVKEIFERELNKIL